jgi:hypothetical protein
MSERTNAELLLLMRVAILVLVVRAGLWLVPFQSIRRAVALLAKPSPAQTNEFSVERLSRAVSTAACYVPKATCLTQALALHILLRRRAINSKIRIGVAKDNGGIWEAHAWVESGDRVVIGHLNLNHYTPMMIWE